MLFLFQEECFQSGLWSRLEAGKIEGDLFAGLDGLGTAVGAEFVHQPAQFFARLDH